MRRRVILTRKAFACIEDDFTQEPKTRGSHLIVQMTEKVIASIRKQAKPGETFSETIQRLDKTAYHKQTIEGELACPFTPTSTATPKPSPPHSAWTAGSTATRALAITSRRPKDEV